MTRILAAVALALLVPASGALAAPAAPAQACEVKLKAAEDARALSEVKLEEEVERADAQNYLTHLELRVTQQRLAAALVKCGAACTPAAPASQR